MPKKKNNQSSIINNQSKKVWRIFHFAGRFELPEDIKICRKSGLQYTKRFVGVAGGDEAVGYQNQFAMLENGDGLQACLLEGIYGRLVNMAAQHSFAKRGYLIDADDQPLSDSQIAKLLNINYRSMGKYLRMFESVKLLEKVELPEFDMSLNEKFDRGKSRGSRNVPENSGKKRKPLKKDKAKSNIEIEDKNKKDILGLKSSDIKQKPRNKQNRQDEGGTEGRGPSQEATTTSPATAPPICPTESDRGGSGKTESDDGGCSKVIPFGRPPGSVDYKRDAGRQIAEAFDELRVRYNSNPAKVAGYEIYVLLGGPMPPHDLRKFSQDVGCFAAAWAKTFNSNLPPPAASELWESMIAEARRLRDVYRRKPNGYQLAKKTWCKPVFRDKLAARLKAM